MNNFYVYGIYDPKKELPFYIGKGCEYRKDAHFQESKKGRNPHRDNKIDKIKREGRQPYSKIIKDNLSEKKAFDLEYLLINIHFENLTNLSKGWGKGLGSGEDHPFYGKSHSKETRQKISDKISGKMLGEDHPMYGKSHSEETLQKLSGKNNPNYGKEFSEEHKRKLAESTSKLSEQEAKEVKWLGVNSKKTQKDIGDEYNISDRTVSAIKLEKIWNHIEPQKPNAKKL